MNTKIILTILAVVATVSVVAMGLWPVSTLALNHAGAGQNDIKGGSLSAVLPQLGALLDRPMASPGEPRTDSGSPYSMCYNGWVQGNDGPTYRCEVSNLPSCI